MENNTPNPTPAQEGNEPATPATPEAAPAGDAAPAPAKPLGTTPGGRRSTPPEGGEAPTTGEGEGDGTEGGAQKTTPENKGQGAEPEVDYKTKFSESSQEAQRLLQVLKDAGIDPKTGKAIDPGEQPGTRTEPEGTTREQTPQAQPPLSDEQLADAIPGFHNMSEAEKAMLRDTKATVRRIAGLEKLVTEMYDERQYTQQIKDLTSKDEFKIIAEHAEEFKELAYKDENLKVPLETLAGNFLYQKGLAAKPAPAPEKPAPGGVEAGGGGGAEGSRTQEGYTADEIANIRKSNPKQYAKLARQGKLKVRG